MASPTSSTKDIEENSLISNLVQFLGTINDETLSEDIEKLISELHEGKKFRIMACGVTGHGKSTFLNGIVGRPIFKQGHGIKSETSEVNEYTERFENSEIVVLDTPGFVDTSSNEKKYLQEIKKKCSEVDTLLYCISMECRITVDTKKQHLSTIKKLKKALNKKVWKSCVIVLTFANQVVDRIKNDPNMEADAAATKKMFNSILDGWRKEVKGILSAASIEEDIPIVAVGKAIEPKLLPDDNYWLSTLWHTIYDKSPSNGRAVLFHFNTHRLKGPEEGDFSCYEPKIHLQDIKFEQSFKKKLVETITKKHPTIAATLGCVGPGGIAGATIGATIGALAIGIPSFGIAVGVGLILGGLIGGGAGVVVGIAAGTAIEYVQEKRKGTCELKEKK